MSERSSAPGACLPPAPPSPAHAGTYNATEEHTILFTNCKVWQWGENLSHTGLGATYSLASWFTVRVTDAAAAIAQVGCKGDPKPSTSSCQQVVDLCGALVLPGLQDSHIHIGFLGESAHYVDLSGAASIEELCNLVQAKADSNPGLSWLVGVGWDQTNWGGAYPSRQQLDRVDTGGRPMFLYRNCWHIGIANSAALQVAGLLLPASDAATCTGCGGASGGGSGGCGGGGSSGGGGGSGGGSGNCGGGSDNCDGSAAGARADGEWLPRTGGYIVTGGQVDVDAGSGLPTGVLRETAVDLVTNHMGAASHEERVPLYSAALQRCVSSGLTAVQTNDGVLALPVYQELLAAGRLPLRVALTIQCDDLGTGGGTRDAHPSSAEQPSPQPLLAGPHAMITCARAKIFGDGSLGAETAALRVPYRDKGGGENRGILIHSDEELAQQVALAKSKGFRLEVHAIGDRAAEQVLAALSAAGVTAADRPIMTHCQILGPDLVKRLADAGMVANVQPSFVPTDTRFVLQRLEPHVAATSYCWRDMMEAGVVCAGGSDAPVENCSPLQGMHDAIYREPRATSQSDSSAASTSQSRASSQTAGQSSGPAGQSGGNAGASGQPEGGVGGVFLHEQCLTFAEALWLYTKGVAFADGAEAHAGAVASGARADFTVVKPGVLENPRQLMDDDSVREVWVAGQRRFHWGDALPPALAATALGGNSMPGKNGRTRLGAALPPQTRVGRCRCCCTGVLTD